jgi:hypothetical protein
VQAAIRPSSTGDFTLHPNTIAIMRVAAENLVQGGLIQAGFGQTNNGSPGLDSCGPQSHLTYYFEFAFSAPNYQCGWVTDSTIPFRYDFSRDFVVERILGTCPGSSSGAGVSWRISIDTYVPLCVQLWQKAQHIIAGGEINTPAGNGQQRGSVSGCFGCDQLSPWQRGTGVNTSGASWYTIRHAHNLTNGAGWTVTPLPGSFTVSNAF